MENFERNYPALFAEAKSEALGQNNHVQVDYTAGDREFEAELEKSIPENARERAFYTKIRGTSHKNADGSSRIRAIETCGILDVLGLRHEPENTFDPNAMAVLASGSGKQLGYLEARLAAEVVSDSKRHGPRWVPIFRHKDYEPESGRLAGAVMFLIRVTDEFAEHSARAIA